MPGSRRHACAQHSTAGWRRNVRPLAARHAASLRTPAPAVRSGGMPRRKPREGGDTAVATEKKTRTTRPRLWRVLLHNDDFTTMEFVVKVLTEVFNKTPAEATDLRSEEHTSELQSQFQLV